MSKGGTPGGEFLLIAILLTVGAALELPRIARADSLNLSAAFDMIDSDSESDNRITGQSTETTSMQFRQRYNLNFSRRIYPYLVFSGGGNFNIEDTESDFDGGSTSVQKRSDRPFFEFKLANPLILTGVGYQDSEESQKIAGQQETTRSRTTYYTFMSLRSEQWPELDLRLSRIDSSSDPKTVDRMEELATVHTRYLFEGGNLDYTFTSNESEDRKNDFRTGVNSHNGKVQYARSYLDGRVSIGGGYGFTHAETELEGAGSVLDPKLRSAGLFSLDLTPADGPALAPIGGLIDGNRITGTSVDIGLAGDETTLTNIGLDLGFTTSVDTIHLWVDRNLPLGISDSFTWYVYTSPDNTDSSSWQLHATVSPGDFDTFENRFEISFPAVDTRFIKVAVMPLLSSVPGASGYPNILVTEMEVFTTITSQDEFKVTNQNLNYNAGWRASDRTSLGIDGFYRVQESSPADIEVSSKANGVFVNHVFNETFTGSARISRQDRNEPDGDTSTSLYSAALRANYMKTFRQTLSYSGTRTSSDLGESRSDGIFLRNNADLYRGVSANLDTGWSWNEDEGGQDSRNTLLRTGFELVPNDVVTVNLDYTANWSRVSGGDTRLKETGSFQTFILPGRYLSLFARVRSDEDEDSRTTSQNYSLNWSPSQGGSVQFFVSYDQRILSDSNKEEEVLSPGLRWRITRYAHLRTTYSILKSVSDTELFDSRNLNANLKINF